MNNKETKELAESMGVSVSDLMCFSRLTANSIEDDGVVDVFLNTDDNNRNSLALAYANFAAIQMEAFVAKLRTDYDSSELFHRKVLDDIQEKQAIIGVIERTEKYLNGEK